jgi:hypothetical protein
MMRPVSPATSTPDRMPGWVRRTTALDSHWPDGFDGHLVVEGTGRDARTTRDGELVVFDATTWRAVIDEADGMRLVSFESATHQDRLRPLVGRPLGGGFRAAMREVLDDDRGSALHQMLDDLPAAVMVSHYARRDVGRPRATQRLDRVDWCAGWRADGTIMLGLREGRPPHPAGPPAPPIVSSHDPAGWHEMPSMRANSTRRRRRIDVGPRDPVLVDAFFRDSHMNAQSSETVIHEYAMDAVMAGRSGRVTDVRAVPAVLPFAECPTAIGSAQRVVGLRLGEVRDTLRPALRGPSTCTHLSDVLATLDDVPYLVAQACAGP